MKFDIENKILVNFISIVILIIIFLGSTSYINSYNIVYNNYEKRAEENLLLLDNYVKLIDDYDIPRIKRESLVEEFIKTSSKDVFIVRNSSVFLVGKSSATYDFAYIYDKYLNEMKENTEGIIKSKKESFVFRTYERMAFTAIYVVKKDFFYDDLLSLQKNLLLIAIISLICSVQVIIFTAHNLSKPIKKLAESCKRISQGAFDEKTDIKRNDEIGMLSESFNEMVDNIKAYTKEIEEVKEFNEDILKNVSLGIMTVDKDFKVTSINEAGIRTINADKTKKLDELILSQMKESVGGQGKINKLYDILQADGQMFFFDVITNIMNGTRDLNGICIFHDVTEKKKIEERIERLKRITSLGTVAAGLAHEIRNPLTGMKASIHVVRNRLKKDDKHEHDELLSVVLDEIERLNVLVSELLDYTKKRNQVLEKTNIGEIIKRVKHLVNEQLAQKKVNFNVDIKELVDDFYFDKDQFEQIMLNIVYNAIGAVESGGNINVSVVNEKTKLYSDFVFSVEDDGCGINKEDLSKIFEPFFTSKSKGTGLGLSVVQKIVEENSGEINVHSEVGVGTTFTLVFPMKI